MKRALLEEFRQAAYSLLGRAHDATFELTDAILLTRNAYSLADLSLSPVFRRKWPSIYEALQDCRPQRQKLMQLYIKWSEVTQSLEVNHSNGCLDYQVHALCYLDLDHFKIVNDTCGHIAGDELLRQITVLLQEKIRKTDTLARLGGDEFGILLTNSTCP
ncbi:GGDEF domain-containing protein [Halotia wernerae UHCC 0503]|nr:GGDEF domain-containing protein [Halotia wernerae UHCC 0503]